MQIACVWNCLFWLKKEWNLWNLQMWSAARLILRNSFLKRVYQVTSSNVILRFCFSSQHPRQSHPFGRVWNQVYKIILLFRNFPQTGPVHQCWNALLSLSFSVRCMRPHFSVFSGENSLEDQRGGLAGHDNSRTFAFPASRVQWNNPECAAAADSSCCRFGPITCAAALLLPLGRDSKHPQGVGALPCAKLCQPSALLAVLLVAL